MQRDRLEINEAKTRIKSQWPLKIKRQIADIIITNNRDIEHMNSQIAAAIQNSR